MSAHDEPSLRLFVVFSDASADPDAIAQQVPAHLRYMLALEDRGAVFAAGPFLMPDGAFSPSGMMILRAGDLAEAEDLAANDPFHTSGVRSFDVRPWQVNEASIRLEVGLAQGRARVT